MSGAPIRFAAFERALSDWSSPSYPGSVSTPSSEARWRAAALSPIARIAEAGGPTQRMPAASTASAKSACSARKP